MSEVSRRADGMASAAFGATVGSAVTALCAVASTAFGEPGFAMAAVPVGAASGWLSQDMADVVASLYHQRRDRMQRFADEAESTSGNGWRHCCGRPRA